MPVGDKIRTVEYNTVQSRVASVLGTGSGSLGYGQTVQSSQVTTSNNITINEWGQLRNDIINIYRHQNNTIPNTTILPEATEGNSIRYNVANAPVTVWDTLSTTLQNNRVNALPVGRFATTVSSSKSQSVVFNATAQVDITFEWASTEQARFFFNGGGRLRIASTFSPDIITSQNTSWQTALSTIGTIEWGGFFPDTSVSGTDGRNWHKSDSTYREYYSSTQSAPYGSNTYKLLARKSNQYVYIRILLTDDYIDDPVDPDNPAPDDLVDGSLTVNTSYTYPTGALTGLGSSVWTGYQPTSISIGNWSVTNRTAPSAPAPPPPPSYSETIDLQPDPISQGGGAFLTVSGGAPSSQINFAWLQPDGTTTVGQFDFLDASGSLTRFFSGPTGGGFSQLGTYTIFISFVGSGNYLNTSVTTV